MGYGVNYNKTYLAITIAAFVIAIFVISSVVKLETTWVGIYNSGTHVMLEYDNEYSPTFFTKSNCEAWVAEKVANHPIGKYMCGKNCRFRSLGLVDCDKLYEY